MVNMHDAFFYPHLMGYVELWIWAFCCGLKGVNTEMEILVSKKGVLYD